MSATHEVENQAPPLVGHDPIAGDAALAEACPVSYTHLRAHET